VRTTLAQSEGLGQKTPQNTKAATPEITTSDTMTPKSSYH